jgi:DNA adenine methylase
MTSTPAAAPLVKWPGGKRRLLPALLHCVPQEFGAYHEPFAGGAALFFALQPDRATLSDLNEDLISMYSAVRDDPDRVISVLRRFRNDEKEYYRIRDAYQPRDRFTKAARFLYLQRLAFNGIYRENLRGEFNVPYGYKTYLGSYSPQEIRTASASLQRAALVSATFGISLRRVAKGDLVYMDPPYTVSHNNNGFIKYNQRLFTWDQQVQLANLSRELARRGVHVIISNAYHAPLLRLYAPYFHVFRFRRFSVIASKSVHRREVSEMVIVSRSVATAEALSNSPFLEVIHTK